jgi:iron(III) transport system permease protein
MSSLASGIASPAWWAERRQRLDFWSLVMLMSVLVLAVLLVLPIFEVLKVGIWNPETGTLSLAAYAKLLTHPYYVSAIVNSMVVGIAGMLGACLLGIPLAYFTTRYALWGRNLIFVLSVMALVSPPFIGAYSWIVVLGNNGWLTRTLAPWGIDLPTIYGVHGIILVFSLKFYPFVYLMTASALRNINRSLEDAAHNLGCSARERFFKVTLPLVLPAVGTAATLCFVLSLADFGTPSIIGREFRTLSTLAYNQYTSEMGGTPTMAVSISMLMIVISMAVVYLQRWSIRNRSYASALLQ